MDGTDCTALRSWLLLRGNVFLRAIFTSIVVNEDLSGIGRAMFQKNSGKLHEIGICHIWFQPPNIIQSFIIALRILNQNVDHQLMLAVFLGQENGLIVITSLPTHIDCRIEVEIGPRFNKSLELLRIFKLGIAVQQKGRMIYSSFVMVM